MESQEINLTKSIWQGSLAPTVDIFSFILAAMKSTEIQRCPGLSPETYFLTMLNDVCSNWRCSVSSSLIDLGVSSLATFLLFFPTPCSERITVL